MGALKNEYFRRLAETTSKVWPVIERQAYAVAPLIRKDIASDIERYLSARRGKSLLRPNLARLCVELDQSLNWEDYLPIFASIELLNISSYQSNFCFDNKGGVSAPRDVSNQYICAMLSISGAMELVTMSPSHSHEELLKVIHLLAESNRQVYEGQYCDLNLLSIDRMDEFSEDEVFFSAYIERCRLIGGSTFRACAAGVANHLANPKVRNCLLSYLDSLGTAGQIINDLADFIPTETRCYAAPLADLKLGRLTLPVYLLHRRGYPVHQWRESVLEHGVSSKYASSIQEALIDIDIETSVRSFIRQRIFPDVKRAIRGLSSVFAPESVESLRFAFHFVYESKLLTYFRQDPRGL